MTLRIRIGTKILALAISLLGLTLVMSMFSTDQAREILSELKEIDALYVPLDDQVFALDHDGLNDRLAFERLYDAMTSPTPDPKTVASLGAEYEALSANLAQDFKHVNSMLGHVTGDPEDLEDLGRLQALLSEAERDYGLRSSLEHQILDRERNRGSAKPRTTSLELLAVHAKLMENLQARRDEMVRVIERLTNRSDATAASQQARLMNITRAASGSAVLFGLVFAWIVTRKMVSPVKTLMAGVQSVEKGDLSVEVPVSSSDEIGVLTGSFNRLVVELRSKEQIKETFGKYIDPRIVESVILNPSSAETEGGRREMSVSFCDLVGFTTIAEQMTPTGLVKLLNRHFALMSGAILEHQGVLDKFIGDAVMAFWGPPFCPSTSHAEQACRAALAKLKALDTFRAELPELTGMRKNLPVMDLRIGLAAGDVVVGNIGSEHSRSYTVMGDTVNVASRLEGINRFYGTRILANETIRDLTRELIEMREIDSIAVKGKTEPARVYEVLGLTGEVSADVLRCRELYQAGLSHYRLQEWTLAEEAFREAAAASVGDGPSALMLTRVAQFREHPPAPGWDGVCRLNEK